VSADTLRKIREALKLGITTFAHLGQRVESRHKADYRHRGIQSGASAPHLKAQFMTNTNGDRDNDLEAAKQILFTEAKVIEASESKNVCYRCAGLTGWRKGKTAHKTS